jgi:hypothetical protein
VWPQAAKSQTCSSCVFLDCHTPAISVPSEYHGASELEPSDPGILPGTRDSSHQNNYGNPEFIPRWLSLDPVEDASGRWLFVVTNMRVQTWGLANPDAPQLIDDMGFSQSGLQAVIDGHTSTVFSSVRATPGNSNQISVGGTSGAGIGVFNTSVKNSATLRYQDQNKDVGSLYAARLGNRDYVFAAGVLGGAGVRAYDLTAVAALSSTCVESTPGTNLCGSVHVGRIPEWRAPPWSMAPGTSSRSAPRPSRRPVASSSTTSRRRPRRSRSSAVCRAPASTTWPCGNRGRTTISRCARSISRASST